MDKIKFVELTMPRLIMKYHDDALDIAKNDPYKFGVQDISLGEAPNKLDANIVQEQIPEAGTKVAEGERVTIKAFGKYMATVPDVYGKTGKQAAELVIGADLKPGPFTVDVPHDQKNGIVLSQNPAAGTRQESQTEVTYSVSKRLPPPPKKTDEPVEKQTQKEDPVDDGEGEDEEEPPLRELVVSPGGATIEVGQSVAFIATPIFLFPERTMSQQGIANMNYQWITNLPGMASVAGSGRNATLTALKEGTVNILCITDQAMGLATIVIKPSTRVTQADNNDSGFKDSNDKWDSKETKNTDDNNKVNESDGWENTVSDDNKQEYKDQDQNYVEDPYAQQQAAQDAAQQAYEDQQKQQQLINLFGIVIGMVSQQIQADNQHQHSSSPPTNINILLAARHDPGGRG